MVVYTDVCGDLLWQLACLTVYITVNTYQPTIIHFTHAVRINIIDKSIHPRALATHADTRATEQNDAPQNILDAALHTNNRKPQT